jgi:hypothetical protein
MPLPLRLNPLNLTASRYECSSYTPATVHFYAQSHVPLLRLQNATAEENSINALITRNVNLNIAGRLMEEEVLGVDVKGSS